MAEVIRMPKMSDTMLEGVIANWNVKVGDKVKNGDILAEVETDKATMDMESYFDGTLLYIGVEKGKAVPVDALLAIIGNPGEDFSGLVSGSATPSASVTETAPKEIVNKQAENTVAPLNINAVALRMPKMSDTMLEGVIHTWLKKVGDKVKSGDIIAEVETDKATMELENYEDGTILYISEAGKPIIVDGIIAIVGEPGTDFTPLLNSTAPAAPVLETKSPAPVPIIISETKAPITPISAPLTTENSNGRIIASPLAKKIAAEKGINISAIAGSGDGGRVVKNDVINFVPTTVAAHSSTNTVSIGQEHAEELPLSQMRKAIARSLADSQSTAVDFQLTMEINMDKAMAARAAMNEASPVKISFNDLILKACGVALKKHPNVNSSWREDHIKKNSHVHIGMAVAIPEGLVVPVIRFADTLPLSVLAATTKELGGLAKSGKLQPKDWEGNTFTVSNLGMFGIESFTSIINNPKNESCILSVGGIKETVGVKNGAFYVTNIMKVTLTCDHRVVDGATGAAFMVTLKELIEEPIRLLV